MKSKAWVLGPTPLQQISFLRWGLPETQAILSHKGIQLSKKNSMNDSCIIHIHTVLEGFAYPLRQSMQILPGSMVHPILNDVSTIDIVP